MKYFKVMGLVAALAILPAVSRAELAYTAADTDLLAGPAPDYPVVVRLGAGLSISVEGCLGDYQWCDVIAGPYRGWMYAGNIVYPYQGSNVPVLTYGAVIGIGILAFSLGDYWDRHYRARPWYPQRQLWIDRPRPAYAPGYRPPPPPPPAPHAGPGGPRPPQQGEPPRDRQRPPRAQPPQGQPAQTQPPGGGSNPPQVRPPGGGQHPPQGRSPEGGQHPPQGQAPGGGQRPAQHQGSGGERRPPQGQEPGSR